MGSSFTPIPETIRLTQQSHVLTQHISASIEEIFQRALKADRDNYKDFAATYFHYTAMRGHPYAQYYLAVAFLTGDGVAQDYILAFKWLTAAGMQGHKYAKKILDRICMSREILLENHLYLLPFHPDMPQYLKKCCLTLG